MTIVLCAVTMNIYSSVRVLNIINLKLSPNPFTPHSNYTVRGAQGLRISFKVETLSRFFWLTARVYNLQGNLVRTITELEPKFTDVGDKFADLEVEIWWDGKNDVGQYANNGRYLVHIKISDTEAQVFSSEQIESIVLIK